MTQTPNFPSASGPPSPFGGPELGPAGPPLLAEPANPEPAVDHPDEPQRPHGAGPSTAVAALIGALIGALICGGVVLVASRLADRDRTNHLLAGKPLDIAGLLDKVGPSIVSIQAGDSAAVDAYEGSGSGIVLDDDGLILTNAHVVNGAQRLKVGVGTGDLFDAKFVGSYPDRDIALIRVTNPSRALRPATLGSPDGIKVGDEVVAIGNALNLGSSPSVTKGIVSAMHRRIETSVGELDDLIQTDAAINPGNSGGALVNAEGRVIGVVSATARNGQGVGFAIDVDSVKTLIADIKNGRAPITADSAFLGVRTVGVDDLTVAERESLGSVTKGAVVREVVQGSPADDAGMLEGDVIVAVDGATVVNPDDVGALIRKRKPGDTVKVDVATKAGRRTVSVKLGRTGG